MTSARPLRKKGIPRQASSYRAARRNRVLRVEHGVWRGPNARYVPMAPRGSSAARPPRPFRLPPRTYRPNGEREIARRLRQVQGGAS